MWFRWCTVYIITWGGWKRVRTHCICQKHTRTPFEPCSWQCTYFWQSVQGKTSYYIINHVFKCVVHDLWNYYSWICMQSLFASNSIEWKHKQKSLYLKNSLAQHCYFASKAFWLFVLRAFYDVNQKYKNKTRSANFFVNDSKIWTSVS